MSSGSDYQKLMTCANGPGPAPATTNANGSNFSLEGAAGGWKEGKLGADKDRLVDRWKIN